MTYKEAVQAAGDELDRTRYALEFTRGVYNNPGLRKAYQNKEEWLSSVVYLAETALKDMEEE